MLLLNDFLAVYHIHSGGKRLEITFHLHSVKIVDFCLAFFDRADDVNSALVACRKLNKYGVSAMS